MFSDDHALYANHRRFLEAQRGALTRHEGCDVVHGDIPAFQIAMLHDVGAAAEAAQHAAFVFAPPWADPGPQGFEGLAYQLTYMSLPRGALPSPSLRDRFVVMEATDETELSAFTEVQAAGFADSEEERPELYAWMWDKNQRALGLRDQHFYCLWLNDEPVSVLLTVDSGDVLGIYAVATPPSLRQRGLSSYLLGSICARALEHQQVCLQVMRGSDAERLYTKLGFVERFVVNVYASPPRN